MDEEETENKKWGCPKKPGRNKFGTNYFFAFSMTFTILGNYFFHSWQSLG